MQRPHLALLFLTALLTAGIWIGTGSARAQGGINLSELNPLKCEDIPCVLQAVVSFLLDISVPILVIMIIWGAFLLVTAGGSEEQIRKAKKVLTWSVIGFAIITIGWGIADLIGDLLGGRSTLR